MSNNMRPLNTLAEDFAFLGLTEMGEPAGAPVDPRIAKKQALIAKKMGQLKKLGSKVGMPAEDENFDFDADLDDDFEHDESGLSRDDLLHLPEDEFMAIAHELPPDTLQEFKLLRKLIHKGVAFKLKRKEAKKYRKAHRAQIARMGKKYRKTARAKRSMKLLAKLPKAVAGKIRRVLSHKEYDGLDSIGETLAAISTGTNTASMAKGYSDMWRLAEQTANEFDELRDDYVSTLVDFGVMAEACRGIAHEAQRYFKALSENDEVVSAGDRQLLEHHHDDLAEEVEGLALVMLETKAAIGITEGTLDGVDYDGDEDDDEDDDELEEMLGFQSGSALAGGFHGESPMAPITGYGNDSDTGTFNVMMPLGISRVGSREKLMLLQQLAPETSEGRFGR